MFGFEGMGLSLKHPIRSAVLVYLLLICLLIVLKPKIVTTKKRKCYLPVAVVMLSVIVFYVFVLLNRLFG